jgi:hypothetical protein
MLTTVTDPLKSKVIELECLHHYCMQLREVAEILHEELQLVCNDGKTQARLGNAGKERVRRDFKTLFMEQQKLHRELEIFIRSNKLDVTIEELPTGFSASDFLKTFALDGPYNRAITDSFIAICKGASHEEEK